MAFKASDPQRQLSVCRLSLRICLPTLLPLLLRVIPSWLCWPLKAFLFLCSVPVFLHTCRLIATLFSALAIKSRPFQRRPLIPTTPSTNWVLHRSDTFPLTSLFWSSPSGLYQPHLPLLFLLLIYALLICVLTSQELSSFLTFQKYLSFFIMSCLRLLQT